MNQNYESALMSIYDNHYCQMVIYARKFVKSTSTAEDIVQDLFVKLLTKPAVNMINTGFVYVCLKNSAINFISSKNHKNIINDSTIDDLPVESISDLAEIEERERRLRIIISELPPKCREVLNKIYFEKMKYADAAKEMNLSFHTVKSQMNIAFSTIKKRMNSFSSFILFMVITLNKSF
ncbi:MAG: sigma-70 family RNA polymerase sigma factor [Bacteroidales bacterium]